MRPDATAVGTIVWLSSELMFFAALFAMYFTLRSVSPDLWATQPKSLNVVFSCFTQLTVAFHGAAP